MKTPETQPQKGQNPLEVNNEQAERQEQIKNLERIKKQVELALEQEFNVADSESLHRFYSPYLTSFAWEVRNKKIHELEEPISKILFKVGIMVIENSMRKLNDENTIGDKKKRLDFFIDDVGHLARPAFGNPVHPMSAERILRAFRKLDIVLFRLAFVFDGHPYKYEGDLTEEVSEMNELKEKFRGVSRKEYMTDHIDEMIQLLQNRYRRFIEGIKDSEEYSLDISQALQNLNNLIDTKITELKSH